MNKSVLLSVLVVVALGAWMYSGQIEATKPQADDGAAALEKAQQETASVAPMRVQVKTMRAEQITQEVVLQGESEPFMQVAVAAETAGVVKQLVATKGHEVKKGELIAELSMETRDAQRREARALLKQRQADQKAALKLNKRGLQSDTQLAQAEAALAAARANLARVEMDIQHVKIHAPIQGVLNEQMVEAGEFIDRGQAVARLVDISQLLITAQVSQQSVSQLSLGQAAKVIFLTGGEAQGQITFISASADPGTRSFRVEVTLDNAERRWPAGLSAEIRVPVKELPGYFVSPAMLALGASGELGLKAVDVEDRVAFYPVDVVRTQSDGAWVSGLPEQLDVITLGQGFVRAGEKVTPQRNQGEG